MSVPFQGPVGWSWQNSFNWALKGEIAIAPTFRFIPELSDLRVCNINLNFLFPINHEKIEENSKNSDFCFAFHSFL